MWPRGGACLRHARRHGAVVSATARPQSTLSLDAVVAYCKRRGFVYPGSELYGSIGTGYDYGPLGAQLKKNVQDAWWRDFVERRADCVGVETALLMNPRVWEASGHVQQFVDPLSECAACRSRVRADKAVEEALRRRDASGGGGGGRIDAGSMSLPELAAALTEMRVPCPVCGAVGEGRGLGPPRVFNLLFSTHVGPTGGGGAHPPLDGAPTDAGAAAPVAPPAASAASAAAAAAAGLMRW